MDKLASYRSLIKQIMSDLAELANRSLPPDVRLLCAFDEERDQYLLLSVGWQQDRRVRGTTIYVRIYSGKFWIEEDWTEHGITKDLLAAGVPNDDIVLAFHHPEMRRLTDFAIC